MSGMAIDGLISGLNTTDLVNSLMQLEAAPQTLLKNKSSDVSRVVSALRGLNTRVASPADGAEKATKAASWDVHKATPSSQAVTATAAAGAQRATLTFSLNALAQGQVSMLEFGDPAATPALTITRGDKTFPVLPTPSDPDAGITLKDIAAAINNNKEAKVHAALVQVGTDGEGKPSYALQLTGPAGKANAFAVAAGGAAHGETVTPLASRQMLPAEDARVTLWPRPIDPDAQSDEPEPITISSESNTFADVLPGVSFTVSKVSPEDEPVTLRVEPDTAGRRKLVADLVSNLSVVLSDIASQTATTTKTDTDGRTVVTGGVLSGDASIRFLTDSLRSAISNPVNGTSPSAIGITLDRAGTITFDQAAFDKAMAEDPEATQAMAVAIAGRVGDVAHTASDPVDGTLTQKIKSQEGMVSDLGRQIEDWDRRLELRRPVLLETYSALEVTLSNLQSQSTWLAGQLATLPTYSSSKG